MSDSIHTARWLSQFDDQGWDIHLFPSIDCGVTHPDMKHVTVWHSFFGRQRCEGSVKNRGVQVVSAHAAFVARQLAERLFPQRRVSQLQRLIRMINPDVIHSMETQAAGYLVAEARKKTKENFPCWMHTLWGSDLYLYGEVPEHRDKIAGVLAACDQLLCECRRDEKHARQLGFRGDVTSLPSAAGGFDPDRCEALQSGTEPSERKNIMLKGYQGWAGRAMIALQALEQSADILHGYTVTVFSAATEVISAAERFARKTGIQLTIVPNGTPHEEMLRLHGRSRISIGLSISDGLPSSLLEAMVMGSFPIQSWTACADEWISDKETGLLVPPEDAAAVEKALRRALTDDTLVNAAAEKNADCVKSRLDRSSLKKNVIEMYRVHAEEVVGHADREARCS